MEDGAHLVVEDCFHKSKEHGKESALLRVGKVDDLDKSWQHMTILANATNKKNYAVHRLMMARVLHDTHPRIRSLLDHDRVYRETDKPCTGRGKGTIIERVALVNLLPSCNT